MRTGEPTGEQWEESPLTPEQNRSLKHASSSFCSDGKTNEVHCVFACDVLFKAFVVHDSLPALLCELWLPISGTWFAVVFAGINRVTSWRDIPCVVVTPGPSSPDFLWLCQEPSKMGTKPEAYWFKRFHQCSFSMATCLLAHYPLLCSGILTYTFGWFHESLSQLMAVESGPMSSEVLKMKADFFVTFAPSPR